MLLKLLPSAIMFAASSTPPNEPLKLVVRSPLIVKPTKVPNDVIFGCDAIVILPA
jgi:hypothetical protein